MDEKFITKLQYGNLGEVLEYLKENKIEKVSYSLYKKGDWCPSLKYVVTKDTITQYSTSRNFHTDKKILCEDVVTYDYLWRFVWSKIFGSKSKYKRIEVTVCNNRNTATRALKI